MSNEEPKVTKILCIILCGYERHQWVTPELMEFTAHAYLNFDFATIVTKAYNFIPASSARNYAAKASMNMTPAPDWLLMIDNDMSPPLNLLDTVKNAPSDAMVIVPKFHLWDGKKTKLCWGMTKEAFDALPDGPNGRKEIKDNQYFEIDKLGTGAIFIRPELFRKIPSPWFEYKNNPETGAMESTEDIIFAKKVLDAGFKMYGYSGVVVGHQHTVNLADLDKVLQKAAEISEPECSTV